jgi:hypothetical protein
MCELIDGEQRWRGNAAARRPVDRWIYQVYNDGGESKALGTYRSRSIDWIRGYSGSPGPFDGQISGVGQLALRGDERLQLLEDETAP